MPEIEPRKAIGSGVKWVDERLGVAKAGRTLLDKIFPDHWSFLLGEIALYSFIILILTGIFLSLYFEPSSARRHLQRGRTSRFDGQHVSAAFASTVNLSFAVRSGLVIRQMHHWAADVFVGVDRRPHVPGCSSPAPTASRASSTGSSASRSSPSRS